MQNIPACVDNMSRLLKEGEHHRNVGTYLSMPRKISQ
jgi:hypothetical protein